MADLTYEQKWEETIRGWFQNHQIMYSKKADGVHRITFKNPKSMNYYLQFLFGHGKLMITGDLDTALYDIDSFDFAKNKTLYQFTKYLSMMTRSKWKFDSGLAIDEITTTFLDWCDVEKIEELNNEDSSLLMELYDAAQDWSDYESFSNYGVSNVYLNTDVDWFDGECAEIISHCGRRLSPTVIAYWVAIQMIKEDFDKLKESKGE